MSKIYKDKNGKEYTLEEAMAVIPMDTYYCYTPVEAPCEANGRVYKTKPCPFRDRDSTKDEQEDGYCHFLESGDWEDDGMGILWDGCKECGINEEVDWAEQY